MDILGKLLPEEKNDKKTIYKILGTLVIGLVLLVVSSMYKAPQPEGKNSAPVSAPESEVIATSSRQAEQELTFEAQMEKRLKDILKKMQGVGEVEVMITTTYGKEIILAEDITSNSSSTTEEDTEGGKRTTSSYDDQKKVVMQTFNVTSGNEPIVIKEKQPEIQGVLVIAQGASSSVVKQSITEAAQILLGVPTHRVTVHQLQTLK